jgi:GTP-binding protein
VAVDFVLGAADAGQFPEPLGWEAAFMGRSNSGKSSMLNRLLGRKAMARVSSEPGRTREINFFKVLWRKGGEPFYVVDFPGYGFARAPKAKVQGWGKLAGGYLSGGRGQKSFLLVDVRRSLAEDEFMLLDLFRKLGTPAVLVATKCDKLSKTERAKKLAEWREAIPPDLKLLAFSALTGEGREELILEAMPPEAARWPEAAAEAGAFLGVAPEASGVTDGDRDVTDGVPPAYAESLGASGCGREPAAGDCGDQGPDSDGGDDGLPETLADGPERAGSASRPASGDVPGSGESSPARPGSPDSPGESETDKAGEARTAAGPGTVEGLASGDSANPPFRGPDACSEGGLEYCPEGGPDSCQEAGSEDAPERSPEGGSVDAPERSLEGGSDSGRDGGPGVGRDS